MLCNHIRRSILALALAFALPLTHAQSVGSAFTYQGDLRASGTAANAAYDFQFRLYNAASGGTQLGTQVPANAVTVSNGLFSVPLDFGPAQFAGDAQWLEISVRPAGSGTFETLSPRTAVTPTPYALGAVAALANSVTTTSIVDGAVQFSDVNAAQFQARVTGTCTGSQGIQSIGANGTVVCGTFSGGSGTITGVTAGTGLTGGGTSGAVTLGIASGGVGTSQINASQVQARVAGTCPSGQYVRVVNQDGSVTCGTDATGTPGWGLTGNGGTNPATNYIGTTDAQPLELRVNGTRVWRAAGVTSSSFGSGTNVVAGFSGNGALATETAQTIGGGGISGAVNSTGNSFATVAGGIANSALGLSATVAGGNLNRAVGNQSAVGGGIQNSAIGGDAVVGGGDSNTALGRWSMVGGGIRNCAGGLYSWAGGAQAKVRVSDSVTETGLGCEDVANSGDGDGDEGTFVWADGSAPFASTGPGQFLVSARGGAAFNGQPALSSVELSLFGNNPFASGGYANLFMRAAGAPISNAGVLVSVGDSGNTAGNNDAAFYIDQFNGSAQSRRLQLSGAGNGRFAGSGGSVSGAQAVLLGGLDNNIVAGSASAIVGGFDNTASSASRSVIVGGSGNLVTFDNATTLGSLASTASAGGVVINGSIACSSGTGTTVLGRRAKTRPGTGASFPGTSACAGVATSGDVNGDEGTFVYADSQDADFVSTGPNQFNIRAAGGVNLHTSTSLSFGSQTRQMIDLWGAAREFGIGVQTGTQYFRSNDSFAWFRGGSHENGQFSPGVGGTMVASLNSGGGFSVYAPAAEPQLSLNFGGNPAGGVPVWSMSGLRSPLSGLGAGSFLLATNAAARFGVQPDGVTRNATGVWATFSDARLKKNIHAIESPLDTYLKLRGHWFEYIDAKSVMADEGERMGFVAQEVRDAVPQWVRESEDGILSVVPTGFEALTVEAVRQLHEENAVVDDEQLRRIEWLETENTALRNRSASLEEMTRQLLDRVSALEAGAVAPR